MFDHFDAQARNPQPYGTYRDTPEAKALRMQKWGQHNISPLGRKLGKPITERDKDGAFRRFPRETAT